MHMDNGLAIEDTKDNELFWKQRKKYRPASVIVSGEKLSRACLFDNEGQMQLLLNESHGFTGACVE